MTTLLLRPSRDKRAYRLRCRFKTDPRPGVGRLEREKGRIAERFVEDMKKQGWDYLPQHGFTMKGPFPYIQPVTIHVAKTPSAREMIRAVAQGARYVDQGGTQASAMPTLAVTEWWEYELAGVFSHETILTEYPDPHEEEKG